MPHGPHATPGCAVERLAAWGADRVKIAGRGFPARRTVDGVRGQAAPGRGRLPKGAVHCAALRRTAWPEMEKGYSPEGAEAVHASAKEKEPPD